MDKIVKGILIMLMFTFSSVFTVHTFCIGGYEVVAEGKTIGFVENKETVEEITNEFDRQLILDYGESAMINHKIEFVEKTGFKNSVTSYGELEKNISTLSEYLTEAYILIVSGEKTIAFRDLETLQMTLEEYKNEFVIDDGSVDICENVEYTTEYISKSQIYDMDNALSYIKSNNLLNVCTTVKTKYTQTVEFDIETKEDDTMYKGSTIVNKEGNVGESIITAEIKYINGEEKLRTVLNEQIIKEPVTQYETIGTLEPPPDFGTGEFIYPIEGTLTSEYGQRWGRLHGGIDLAAKTGTKILSSDNGKVIYAGMSGSYGLLVKVDHGNGYVTYYAHCSELLCNLGDCVTKGETIALVGNTGNSTGPHCHFEIRYDNEPQNPLDYLN